jgi:polyphosphate kinase
MVTKTMLEQLKESAIPSLSFDLPMADRDLSWLAFNHRVLQEAQDPTVPLLERLKFLAIYSSNLEEFFKVRVAQHRNLLQAGKKAKSEINYNPKDTLRKISKTVLAYQDQFTETFDGIIAELAKHGVRMRRRMDLNEEQQKAVNGFFQENMLPFVQPVLLRGNKIRVFLNNAELYLAVILTDPDVEIQEERYAIVKVPSDYTSRFFKLPSDNGSHDVIMLDDIVRHSVSWLFPGYTIIDCFSIKLTRDAELYIDDEFSGDLVSKIRNSLKKRNVGPASRFVYDKTMPTSLLTYLTSLFEVDKSDTLPEGRYHNNFDFFKFPDFGLTHLKEKALQPLPVRSLQNMPDFFDRIAQKDRYLMTPFHSYESVFQFFERAAHDPKVTHIKVVQYRVAKKSRIISALIEAVKLGKQVSVFVEVKARFDEENNLRWAEVLQDAGVKVLYSFPGVKVHSKLALVRRKEADNSYKTYAYLSTGNFNEDTAKIYSDISLFTADPRYTEEATRVFNYLESGNPAGFSFDTLLVGMFNLRDGLEQCVDDEIAIARSGQKAYIWLKMNSLQDPVMIAKLYEASIAGVEVRIIVRGICCLIPGIPNLSHNIEVTSIVDRYLEHSRVFLFGNNGVEKIYLSSADWMVRNLSHRIETCFPVFDPEFRQVVIDTLQIQLNDNCKARLITPTLDNPYRRNANEINMRSQIETYYYLKRIHEEEEVRLSEQDPSSPIANEPIANGS